MSAEDREVRRVVLAPSAYAPSLGGVEELTAKLARALVADGIDVSVSTMRWPKSLPAREAVDGVAVSRRVFRSPDGPRLRRVVARVAGPLTGLGLTHEYRQLRPDVVNIQCVSHAAAYQAAATRRLGIPLVATLQGELSMDANAVYEQAPRLRESLRTLLATADAVTACSHDTLAEAERWFGAPLGERATVIHNGVDVDELREATPMPHPRPYVFALGRHVRQKGFDVLIDAFGLLEQGHRAAHDLVIAGDGAEREALAQQAARLRLGDRVQLIGRTERAETARWFRGATAFVLPSRHEPFGIVNLEAMAAGVPVIASAVGGVPEFVEDGATGVLVPPGQPEALRRALERVLDDRQLRATLVSNAAASVERFRWSTIAGQYLEVYRKARARRLPS